MTPASSAPSDAPPGQEFSPGFLKLAIKINNTHRGALAGDAQAGEVCAAFLAEVKDKLGDRFPPFSERCCPEIGIAGAEARLAARERANAPAHAGECIAAPNAGTGPSSVRVLPVEAIDPTTSRSIGMTSFDAAAVAKEIMQHLAAVESAEVSLISNKRRAAELLQDVAKNHPTRLNEVCDRAGIGASRRKELLQIALGRRTQEEIKCSTRERVKRHRDAKKAREPAKAVTSDVTASPDDAELSHRKTEHAATERKAPHVPPPPVSDAERSLAQWRVACDTWLPRLTISMHAAAQEYVREVLVKAKAAKATNEAA
jgi:hypothetical protein